jgi:hypothetical protein
MPQQPRSLGAGPKRPQQQQQQQQQQQRVRGMMLASPVSSLLKKMVV